MVILGIDYGTRNVGLAISDETELVAAALPLLHWTAEKPGARERLFADIAGVVEERKITKIVLGIPGIIENQIFKEIKKFGFELEKQLGLVVVYWDESFSSQRVERELRGKKRKSSDSLAAQLLLQEYLDFLREKI